jgi:hypothetical protein
MLPLLILLVLQLLIWLHQLCQPGTVASSNLCRKGDIQVL